MGSSALKVSFVFKPFLLVLFTLSKILGSSRASLPAKFTTAEQGNHASQVWTELWKDKV